MLTSIGQNPAPFPLSISVINGWLLISHRELRLNLAGNAEPTNLARTHLHSMGPSKNASNTFSNHFATGFLSPIIPVWALLALQSSKF